MTIVETPHLSNVRALVTTKWSGGGYRARPIRTLTDYYVDTALDTDSDQWQITIADPTLTLEELLERDNEVRVQLYGASISSHAAEYMLTGIADEVSYQVEDGEIIVVGRDMSSLATDSIVMPLQFKHVRSWAIIAEQAAALGFTRTNLAKKGIIKKSQNTDASESYWEFWYRLCRKDKLWLWTEPDGTLISDTLAYEQAPSYYFGVPRSDDPAAIRNQHMGVEAIGIRKTTQQRWAEVVVFGHSGDIGVIAKAGDPTMNGWIKRPRKIMLDTDAHNVGSASKMAYEEIFEGKVGALEITIVVPDPGYKIQQNRIARLRLPDIGYGGEFFVVGARRSLGAEGPVQEVRLREREYAVSRRIPVEIKATASTSPSVPGVSGSLGAGISESAGSPEAWGSYFIRAANKWHGPWDYNLFLACLLGICDQETGFNNWRENGGPGGDHVPWYPPPTDVDRSGLERGGHPQLQLTEWQRLFANQSGDGIVDREYGTGPMQLTSRSLKNEADDLLQGGTRDEFVGGRWHPEWNIMVAAHYLRTCLQFSASDSGRDVDIWLGVAGYNAGPGNIHGSISEGDPGYSYMVSVKHKVLTDPGYLAVVKTNRDAAIDQSKQTVDAGDDFGPKPGFTNSPGDINALTWVKRQDSSVDVMHVDYTLLSSLNSLGARLATTMLVTSGFRSLAEQTSLYDRYRRSGFDIKYIAAKPGTSNHEFGRAVDVTVNGQAIGAVVPDTIMAIYGLHTSVEGDPVHVTKIGVEG
jgi:prophage tail gpP-like protein